MRVRVTVKNVGGKKRWYVVQSYREKETGKPVNRWLVYLGEPPNPAITRFVTRINAELAKESLFVAIRLKLAMESIRRYVAYLRKRQKGQQERLVRRLGRRRELYAAHKRGMPVLHRYPIQECPKTPFSVLIRRLRRLKHMFEVLIWHKGPMETWEPSELSQFLSETKRLADVHQTLKKLTPYFPNKLHKLMLLTYNKAA